MTIRELKKELLACLQAEDLEAGLAAMADWPPRQVVNPLFGLLYHGSERIRWHAVTAMGEVVARLAAEQMEAARVIMRRLMWNLNDESGGIGWGSPEAMGEIMACHAGLAEEYAAILISYLNPSGNYLEHPLLQQGVVWGIGRLAHARPALARESASHLLPLLASAERQMRGLAVWAAGPVADKPIREALKDLCADQSVISLYRRRRLEEPTIAALAAAALALAD